MNHTYQKTMNYINRRTSLKIYYIYIPRNARKGIYIYQ